MAPTPTHSKRYTTYHNILYPIVEGLSEITVRDNSKVRDLWTPRWPKKMNPWESLILNIMNLHCFFVNQANADSTVIAQ